MLRQLSSQRARRAVSLTALFAIGLAASLAIGQPAAGGGKAERRYLQIHPTFAPILAKSGNRISVVTVDIRRIPPGYKLKITAPGHWGVRSRRTGAELVFSPSVSTGRITIVVTRPATPEVVWLGFEKRIDLSAKGPAALEGRCIGIDGRLRPLPCPPPKRPAAPSGSATTLTLSTAAPTTAAPPPPPAPTTTPTPAPVTTVAPAPTTTAPPATTAPVADTTPPSTPGGLVSYSATTDTLNLGWSASSDNKSVTGYKVFLNGGQVGTTGGLNYGYGGLACGTSYTLGVAAYDAAGNTSGVAAIGASTNGCPPPPPTVSVSKGGSAQGRSGCSSSACAYVVVSFANFSGGNHSISCESSVGHIYGPYSGGTPSAVCYFGYPGQTVWATVDGVRSNDLRW